MKETGKLTVMRERERPLTFSGAYWRTVRLNIRSQILREAYSSHRTSAETTLNFTNKFFARYKNCFIDSLENTDQSLSPRSRH